MLAQCSVATGVADWRASSNEGPAIASYGTRTSAFISEKSVNTGIGVAQPVATDTHAMPKTFLNLMTIRV